MERNIIIKQMNCTAKTALKTFELSVSGWRQGINKIQLESLGQVMSRKQFCSICMLFFVIFIHLDHLGVS